MTRRLRLLRRIALLREVEHQAAARAAAAAEGSRGELAALAERTLQLSREYTNRPGHADGATLTQRIRFAGTLRAVHDTSRRDVERATEEADAKLATLAKAGRRRDVVRERILEASGELSRSGEGHRDAKRRFDGHNHERTGAPPPCCA